MAISISKRQNIRTSASLVESIYTRKQKTKNIAIRTSNINRKHCLVVGQLQIRGCVKEEPVQFCWQQQTEGGTFFILTHWSQESKNGRKEKLLIWRRSQQDNPCSCLDISHDPGEAEFICCVFLHASSSETPEKVLFLGVNWQWQNLLVFWHCLTGLCCGWRLKSYFCSREAISHSWPKFSVTSHNNDQSWLIIFRKLDANCAAWTQTQCSGLAMQNHDGFFFAKRNYQRQFEAETALHNVLSATIFCPAMSMQMHETIWSTKLLYELVEM